MTPPVPVRRASWIATAAAAVLFVLVFTAGRPTDFFEPGPFTADFYDEQASALLDGHLDVDPEVASIEGIVHDGRTHLYYGLAPSLARAPVAAVTDSLVGRLGGLSMLGALVLVCWTSGRLAWFGRLAVRGDDVALDRHEPLLIGAFVAVVGASSPFVYLAARSLVYHEAELWGAAAALLAAVALLRWWHSPSVARLVGASAAVALALHIRGSLGAGAAAALGLALLAGWRKLPRPRLLAAGAAVLLPLLSYSVVNLARFETPFSIPLDEQRWTAVNATRQAALDANGGSLFGPQFVPTTAWSYLRPDGVRMQRLFPWVTFRDSTAIIGDPVFDVTERAASLPVTAPVLLVLAVPGTVVAIRRRERPWLCLAVGGVVGASFVLTIAYIANRYLSDLMYPLVVLAALGLWPVAGALGRHARLVAAVTVVLSVAATVVNVALANQAQRLLLLPDRGQRADYVALQYRLDSSDGPAREVRAGGARPGPVPDRGGIAVLDDCAAVYWSDGEAWHALELGSEWRSTVQGDPTAELSPVAVTPTWMISARRDGDEVVLEYRDLDDRTVTERTEAPEGNLVLHVDRDPASSVVTVSRGDEVLLYVYPAVVDQRPEAARGWTEREVPTPLCRQLIARAT